MSADIGRILDKLPKAGEESPPGSGQFCERVAVEEVLDDPRWDARIVIEQRAGDDSRATIHGYAKNIEGGTKFWWFIDVTSNGST